MSQAMDHAVTARSGRRLAHPAAWELAIDVLAACAVMTIAVAARLLIELFVGGVAPFILTFPLVMLATLVRGGRAGTIAVVGCQLLTIRFVFPNWVSVHGGITTDLANVVLSTIALAGTVLATASYRRTARLLRSRCEDRAHTLSLLMSEMDHRHKNDFQVAASLLAHQSLGSADRELAGELNKAALRLEAIASVYQDPCSRDGSPRHVDLADHIGRVVAALRSGAAPEHVRLSYRADHAEVPVDTAIIIGLIVNEWVTNALKHAFAGGPGHIGVAVEHGADGLAILVEDDGGAAGGGMAGGGAAGFGGGTRDGEGRGTELMSSLAAVIDGTIAIRRDIGMHCRLTVPSLRKAA